MIEPMSLENRQEIDHYLADLQTKPGGLAPDEVEVRVRKFVKDEQLSAYFRTKAAELRAAASKK